MTTKAYYASKGQVRYTVLLSNAHRAKIDQLTETFKLSQGDIIEVLLDHVDEVALKSPFEAKKANKVDGRGKVTGVKGEILAELKDMTPEQLETLKKQIAGIKG
jgi:hypothetical protein